MTLSNHASTTPPARPTDVPGETVGLAPWYPPPLSWWKWWTQPVRAERLAALRIGLASVLLFDVLTTYLPNVTTFFGQGSLGEPPNYKYMWTETKWNWSLFYGVQDPLYLKIGMIVWIIAIAGLLTGCFTRVCAVLAFVLSTSFANINSDIDNAGDTVRGIILFYLAISRCGAAWSVDAWLSRRQGPTFIYPWPLNLLWLQTILIYWTNGMHKIVGQDWLHGNSVYYVLADATLSRVSAVQFHLPYWLTRIMTWTVLAWEVTLPALVIWRPLRIVALGFGMLFHVGIWLSMELGFFPPYMLCLYLPLLPWEKLADRWRLRN